MDRRQGQQNRDVQKIARRWVYKKKTKRRAPIDKISKIGMSKKLQGGV